MSLTIPKSSCPLSCKQLQIRTCCQASRTNGHQLCARKALQRLPGFMRNSDGCSTSRSSVIPNAIGVPKVPFRLPGEPTAQWIDIYNRLYRERVLFLCQNLDDELANQLIGIMLYLNAEEKSKGLYLYINSPGGSVGCGLAVYDTMNYVKAGVTTVCVGTAASMASFILAGGEKGKRIALPHSRIMVHQPEGGSQGQASEIVSEMEEVVRLRLRVARIFAERTGQSIRKIAQDMDRDLFMDAREAKDYGIVDQVAVGADTEQQNNPPPNIIRPSP